MAYLPYDMFAEALADRKAIIETSEGTIGDFYFSGEYAIQAGNFEEAAALLEKAIQCSLNDGSKYYLQSSRLLAALAYYQLHDDNRCRSYLELVDDQEQVLWLKGFDNICKNQILSLINASK